MSHFDILLIGHFVGDYLFQTSWMAANKAKKWNAVFIHSLVYSLCVYVVSWIGFGGLSLLDLGVIFVTHLILDRRTFVVWWVKNIMKSTGKESGWLTIVVDQIFHLIILAIVVVI